MEEKTGHPGKEAIALLPSEKIERVFDYWKMRLNHPRAKLDAKRRTKIRMRLQDGYEMEDLMLAIEGCARSPFHVGENDTHQVYDDIELVCRDAAHVDRFMEIAMREGGKVLVERAQRAEEERRSGEAKEATIAAKDDRRDEIRGILELLKGGRR